MRVERRDFLLLRAGQPAVLSCEQLFMRYLDAQMNGTTAELFAALAGDLRAATSVRLAEPSWLSRDDLKRELDRVLASFTAAGGRIVAAVVVAIALLGPAPVAAAADRIAPKSGAAMCALTAADFAAAGIRTNPKPGANVDDNGASVYCVYAGKSGATGGVELDVFYPAGANANEATATMATVTGELGSKLTPITIAGADEARWSASATSGGPPFATIVVRRSTLVFTLAVPAAREAQAQVLKLVELVLQRF